MVSSRLEATEGRRMGFIEIGLRHLLQKAAKLQEVDWLRAGGRPRRAVEWGSSKSGCGTSCKKRQNCKRLIGRARVEGGGSVYNGGRRIRAAAPLAKSGKIARG